MHRIAENQFRPSRVAGKALAVTLAVLGHLFLMVSPLHAVAVHGEAQVMAAQVQEAPHEVCPGCAAHGLAPTSRHDHPEDCAFPSMRRPGVQFLRLLVAPMPIGGLDSLLAQAGITATRPRVLHPLDLVTSRSFLQVFRN
jgi:hypothetical protein